MRIGTVFLTNTFSNNSIFQTPLRPDNVPNPDRVIVKNILYLGETLTSPLFLKSNIIPSTNSILCPIVTGGLHAEIIHQLKGTFSVNTAYDFTLTEISGILHSGSGSLVIVLEFQQD